MRLSATRLSRRRSGRRLGSELIINGNFANGLTSWSHLNVSLTGQTLMIANAASYSSYIFQNQALKQNGKYLVTIEGTGIVLFRTNTAITAYPVTLPAVFEVANAYVTNGRAQIFNQSGAAATVTLISMKEIL